MIEEPFVCLRTIGERTEHCLLKQIGGEISKENIAIVNETPLTNTLKKAFSLAINKGNSWTLHIDADVLLLPGSLKGMTKKLMALPKDVFAAQFLVADYLLGDIRYAGNGAYRTDLLPLCLPFVAESVDKIRPVRHVIQRMEEKGYRFFDQREEIVGIHDAEQFYRDIYRKALVYAFKHLNKASEFIPYWRHKQGADYLVALKGFSDGIVRTEPIQIDPKMIDQESFSAWLKSHNLAEKKDLSLVNDPYSILSAILEDHYHISKQKKVYRWISRKDL